jgi:hypothetical protein
MSDESVFLYLIAPFGRDHEPLRPVKIGITANMKARLASVQTGSHQRLSYIAAFNTPNRDIATSFERAFHGFYASARLEGEWFNVDPIDAIQVACDSLRNHFARRDGGRPVDFDEAGALAVAGVTEMEFQARRFRAWRSYYAENSNVQAIA